MKLPSFSPFVESVRLYETNNPSKETGGMLFGDRNRKKPSMPVHKEHMKNQEPSMLEGVIERLPKAELHIHIEGSLSWILEGLLHLS